MLCKCCCCVSVTDNWKHFAELQRTFISQSFNMASVRAALSLSLSHSFNVMCNTGRMRVAVKAYSRCAFLIKVKPNATHFRNVRNFYIKHFYFSIYTLPFFLLLKIIIAVVDLSDNYCQKSEVFKGEGSWSKRDNAGSVHTSALTIKALGFHSTWRLTLSIEYI